MPNRTFPPQNLSQMLSDPIDLRVYLTNSEFMAKVLQTKTWHNWLALPPISDFDQAAALAEIEDRNKLRAANHLPPLDVKVEIAKLKDSYDEATFGDPFLTMSSACIREIYGLLTPKDFNSHSAMLSFVTSKRDLIYELIADKASKF